MPNLIEKICDCAEFKCLADPRWRLDNLYYIKDAYGKRVKFNMNWAQREIINSLHPCEIVLKCRQIGMTTVFAILNLDHVLWEDNVQAGIIAQTLDDASKIFKDKLKFAFDNLHPAIRPLFKIVGDSAKELAFSHGSAIRVGTSMRSSTLQYLHISEFGKICATDPERAREIITGSLNTVHVGQSIVIESTAEGNEGRYYEMCQEAEKNVGKKLSIVDFKFRFFPWHRHPEYVLDHPVEIPDNLKEYFDKVSLRGVELSDQQKWWYAHKYKTQREDMMREYPTFSDEAFAASQEGYWYATEMRELRDSGHFTNISYDRALPVHTAWDLGQADFQIIWFFQINRSGEIMVIDYLKKRDLSLNLTYAILQSKGYAYGTHIWPHDARARDRAGITFQSQASDLNLHGYVLENHDIKDGIRMVRSTLGKCWFDQNKCKEGILDLQNYKKKWSSSIGGWTSEPQHDDASHGADAFRYLCAGISKIRESSGSIENDIKAVRAYWG